MHDRRIGIRSPVSQPDWSQMSLVEAKSLAEYMKRERDRFCVAARYIAITVATDVYR